MAQPKLIQWGLIAALCTISLPALAQRESQFPSRQVQIICPFPAGGFLDIIGRVLAERLRAKWQQPVLVVNKVGATGTVGSNDVAKSPPDGHTLLLTVITHSITPGLIKDMPYDAVKDFTAITPIALTQNLLVVRADSPYRSLKEIITAARSKPGVVSYSTSGIGTGTHLMMAHFEAVHGVKFNHVPYSGSPNALRAAMVGETDFGATSVTGGRAQVLAGKVRAIAVGGDTRSGLMPDVPTITEAGFPGVLGVPAWLGILGPAGMNRDLVARIHRDIVEATETPEYRAGLRNQNLDELTTSPAEFGARIAAEVRDLGQVLRANGIKAE